MFQSFGLSPYFTADAAAHAALGGTLLGATVVFKTALTGSVLGISGATRGLCAQKPTAGRLAFVLGLAGSGLATARLLGGTEPLPVAATASALLLLRARLLFGSFFIGVGSALANGCTSGHGLTGLARLSHRSWASVPTFMGVALLAGTLFGASAAMPPQAATEATVPGLAPCLATSVAAAGVLVLLALGAWAKPELKREPWAKTASELVTGSVFGCGLMISSMARPSKVAAFLDLGSGAWDPSLAFVMGGALLITTPFFQLLSFKGCKWQPFLDDAYQLPPREGAVDKHLMVGSVLFGLGWSLCSACPGPIWVIFAARFSLESCLLLAGMLAGMRAWALGRHYLSSGEAACGLGQSLLGEKRQ